MRLQVWRLLTIAMLIAIGGAGLGTPPQVLAQEGTAEPALPAAPAEAGAEESLAEIEARLAERYTRLETLVERLAELSRSTQPRRATLLRQLITQSRDRNVAGQFQKVVDALEQESFSSAIDGQASLETELNKLLELLLQEDRDRQIDSERKRIGRYLQEVNRLIRMQRGVKAPHRRRRRGEGTGRRSKTGRRQDQGTRRRSRRGGADRGREGGERVARRRKREC